MRFCPECGSERIGAGAFCVGCGGQFPVEAGPAEEDPIEEFGSEDLSEGPEIHFSEAQPQYTSPSDSPVHDNNPSITVWEQIGGVPRNTMIAIGVALILVVGGGAYMMMKDDVVNWTVPEGAYWDGYSTTDDGGMGWYFESDGSVHYVTADDASDCADQWVGDFTTLLRQEGPVCHWDVPDGSMKWNKDTPFIWGTGGVVYEVCWTSTPSSGQSESECNLILVGKKSYNDREGYRTYIIWFEPGIRCLIDGEAGDVLYPQWNDGENDCDSGLDEGIDQWNYHSEDGEMNYDLYHLMRDSPAERVICDLYVKGDTPINTHHEDIFNEWREEFFLPVLNGVNNPHPLGCNSFDHDWNP